MLQLVPLKMHPGARLEGHAVDLVPGVFGRIEARGGGAAGTMLVVQSGGLGRVLCLARAEQL